MLPIPLTKRRLLTTDEIVRRFKEAHGDKFDYSEVNYIAKKVKVAIGCPNHGRVLVYYKQFIKSKYGCPACGREQANKIGWDSKKNKTNYQLYIRDKLKSVHGDLYTYQTEKIEGYNHKIQIVCKSHGEFSQQLGSHLMGSGCPQCAREGAKNKSPHISINDVTPCRLYFLHLYNNCESFYKIGITTQLGNSRFQNLGRLSFGNTPNFDIGTSKYYVIPLMLVSLPRGLAYRYEQNILKEYAYISYTPKLKIEGYTECISQLPRELIAALTNIEYNVEQIVNEFYNKISQYKNNIEKLMEVSRVSIKEFIY